MQHRLVKLSMIPTIATVLALLPNSSPSQSRNQAPGVQRPPNARIAYSNSYRLRVSVEPRLRAHLAADTLLAGATVQALRGRGEPPASWIRLTSSDTIDTPNVRWRQLWTSHTTQTAPWVSDSLFRVSLKDVDVSMNVLNSDAVPAASEMLAIVASDLREPVISRLSWLERVAVGGRVRYGFLQTDAQKVADPGARIDFSIAAVPLDTLREPLPSRVEIRFEANPKIEYARNSVTLAPRGSARVRAHLTGKGLIPIFATAPGWAPLVATVVAGFPGRFQLRVDGKLEHTAPQTLLVTGMDETGSRLRADVPITVTLVTKGARLRTRQSNPWSEEVTVTIARGSPESPLVEIEPTSLGYSNVSIQSTAQVDEDYVIDMGSMTLAAEPPWFVRLVLSIVGSLLGFGARGARQVRQGLKAPWITGFVAVTVPGVLAYLITDLNVPIVHVQPSGSVGNVLIGFLAGYLGTDFIVRVILHEGNGPATSHPRGRS